MCNVQILTHIRRQASLATTSMSEAIAIEQAAYQIASTQVRLTSAVQNSRIR